MLLEHTTPNDKLQFRFLEDAGGGPGGVTGRGKRGAIFSFYEVEFWLS